MYDLPRDSHAAVIHEYQTIIDVVDWNNSEERTAQEVIDALRLAARVAIKENA